jgi:hypothetical protein
VSLVDAILAVFGIGKKVNTNPISPMKTANTQATVPSSLAQASPQNNTHPNFRLYSADEKEILKIWVSAGKKTKTLPKGFLLWHAGEIGPAFPVRDDRALWSTCLATEATHYNERARQDFARGDSQKPYLTNFETVRALNAVEFDGKSFRDFTFNFCKSNHDAMRSKVTAWLEKNGFEAAIGTNGGKNEVVILKPESDLAIINQTPV